MITKKIISIFTFGIFLIIVGAIFKLLDKPQANLIMSVGLVFESLAILLYVWNKIKKNG